MAKHIDNSLDSAENPASLVVEIGTELNRESLEFEMKNMVTKKGNETMISTKKKSIFERRANTSLMVLFTIMTNLFAALCGAIYGSNYFDVSSFRHRSLVTYVAMLNLYVSIIGMVLSRALPWVARGGFNLMAFLSALLSIAILFGAMLPSQLLMKGGVTPWIFMAHSYYG